MLRNKIFLQTFLRINRQINFLLTAIGQVKNIQNTFKRGRRDVMLFQVFFACTSFEHVIVYCLGENVDISVVNNYR